MGIEEQDRILGRLVRESGELRRLMAAYDVKLRGFAEELDTVARHLRNAGVLGPDAPGPKGTIQQAIAAVQNLPVRDEILKALRDAQTERERLDSLNNGLAQFDMR